VPLEIFIIAKVRTADGRSNVKSLQVLALSVFLLGAGSSFAQQLPQSEALNQPTNRHPIVIPMSRVPATPTSTKGGNAPDDIGSMTPNDPGTDLVKADQVMLRQMLDTVAWAKAHGLLIAARTIGAAIIDSGPQRGSNGQLHPDLVDGWEQYYVSVVGGQVVDVTLHGNSVHATANASTNNGTGIPSTGLGSFTGTVKVVHITIFRDGTTTLQDEVNGIDAVAALIRDQHLPIWFANVSWGGNGKIIAEAEAFKRLTDMGVVVFAGLASSTPGAGCTFYPACLYTENPRVVPVVLLNDNADGIDPNTVVAGIVPPIGAPGHMPVPIDADHPDDVGRGGGPSIATPQVLGAAALAMSLHNGENADDAWHRVLICATPINGTARLSTYCSATLDVMFTNDPGTGATALDAATLLKGPFPKKTANFATGMQLQPTRIALYLYNLPAGTLPADLRVSGQLASGSIFDFTVDGAKQVPGHPFLTTVVVIAPQAAAASGTFNLSLTYRGTAATNHLPVTIQ